MLCVCVGDVMDVVFSVCIGIGIVGISLSDDQKHFCFLQHHANILRIIIIINNNCLKSNIQCT